MQFLLGVASRNFLELAGVGAELNAFSVNTVRALRGV
jgi:hypothetical protein